MKSLSNKSDNSHEQMEYAEKEMTCQAIYFFPVKSCNIFDPLIVAVLWGCLNALGS